jgi:hypothetical protein
MLSILLFLTMIGVIVALAFFCFLCGRRSMDGVVNDLQADNIHLAGRVCSLEIDLIREKFYGPAPAGLPILDSEEIPWHESKTI